MIYFPWLSKRITFQTDHYFCPSHPFLWEIPLHPFPIRFFSSSLILLHFCCRASLASVPTMDDVQIILDILQWHPAPSSVSAQGAGHTPLPNLCRLHIGMAPCRSCFDPGEAQGQRGRVSASAHEQEPCQLHKGSCAAAAARPDMTRPRKPSTKFNFTRSAHTQPRLITARTDARSERCEL